MKYEVGEPRIHKIIKKERKKKNLSSNYYYFTNKYSMTDTTHN